MKQFPNIIAKLFYEPVVITPQKHMAICQVIEAHMGKGSVVMDDDGDDDSGDDDLNYQQFGSIAVIPVHGVIEKHMKKMASAAPGCDLDILNAMIDVAEMDPSVEKLLFDFRTPGGSVTGMQESGRKIFRCSKETIGFTDSECCSGGMWLASQCNKFYSTSSARVGSIGVWCAYLDISRQMQNEGENMQAISAGKHKLIGAYWKPLAAEEKDIIQKGVDKIYTQFKDAVNSRRQLSEDDMGAGLIFDGDEAAQRGLTDGIAEDMDEILNDLV